MNNRSTVISKIAIWLQICGVLFVVGGMALAEGAAGWNFVAKTCMNSSEGAVVLGAAMYLAMAIAGLAGLRWLHRRGGSRVFLWTALAVSMMIQAAAILTADRRWVWTGDAHSYSQYLDKLSENGYSAAALEELSENYDYPLWTRRALPFYYALRIATGSHFVLAIQIFQALLITLSLSLTWRIARLLFGRRIAFWAVSLQLLMPYRWFICLDLSHYIPGGFYFAAAVWGLVEWCHGTPGAMRKWGVALLLALLLPLMKLEGGIDQLYLIGAFSALLFQGVISRIGVWRTLAALLAWVVGPLLVSHLLVSPISNRIAKNDMHQLSCGTVAFVARGWMPETGGEYSGTYELIDWLTSADDKISMQASLLVSQALYNPKPLLFRLLPTKCAKYFLLGYASGTEEILQHNGARRAALLTKGARMAYLLTTLPLMIWGGFLWLPRLRRPRWLCLTMPCLLFCAATTMVGETSPRYSFYIQPLLFIMGALPLAWGARRRGFLFRAARIPTGIATASGLAVLLFVAGLLFVGRPWLRHHAVLDLRKWSVSPSEQRLPSSATLAPFEIHLLPASDMSLWGKVHLPIPVDLSAELTFYLLPMAGLSASHNTPAILRRQTNQGLEEKEILLPARISLKLNAGDARSFELLSLSTPPPFPLSIGYAHVRNIK